ncbi:hypothetical protein B0H63DRAFT_506228 [Podospora didyma]|uniref:Uncharacterized protein n=1 Tax=Podospora didyma TaxID=330526 RepID=A0AAE0P729_9PEZI|nr:hypothetical protein B0H63DRAFT_506228 [Podospora didyma]
MGNNGDPDCIKSPLYPYYQCSFTEPTYRAGSNVINANYYIFPYRNCVIVPTGLCHHSCYFLDYCQPGNHPGGISIDDGAGDTSTFSSARLAEDSRSNSRGTFGHGSVVSPESPGSMTMLERSQGGGSPNLSELDSMHIYGAELEAISISRHRMAEFEATVGPTSRQTTEWPIEGPRATLNSTRRDRASNTYAESWTRFQNIQI